MDRFLKGLLIVLAISALVWLTARRGGKPEAPSPMGPPSPPVGTTAPPTQAESLPVIEPGERAVSTLPPMKLIREKKPASRTAPPPPPIDR